MEVHFRKTIDEFITFFSGAQNELIVLCPYIKLKALSSLLQKVDDNCKVIVVVRWRLSDLVLGSSDLKIYPYLKKRGIQLYRHKDIHLKVAVRDKREVLLGSANITSSGLGLKNNSNIEAIAIGEIEEISLDEVLSILKEAIMINDQIFEELTAIYEKNKELFKNRKALINSLNNEEKKIFPSQRTNLLVSDFPFTKGPYELLKNINDHQLSSNNKHDLNLLNVELKDIKTLKKQFLISSAYLWQKEIIKNEILFGEYSEILHNSLMDDPRPYRKRVKELVANMFEWTEVCSDEFEIVRYNHTVSMKKK